MSKFTAVAYYGGIPIGNKNPEKPLILDNFCKGVVASGDVAIAHRGKNPIDCDVAFIQGFVHEHGKTAPHLLLRQQAIDFQKRNNKRSLIVDSNLFLYVDTSNPKKYLRYSFDGVFPNTGFYFDQQVNPARWEKISHDLKIQLKPYRKDGNHILVCLQRHGGWSMGGLSILEWLDKIIHEIRLYSKRTIIVRTHPGDKKIKSMLNLKYKNVFLSTNEKLKDDLKNSWVTVVYNSSPSVASLLEGIPTFLTDPIPQRSQSFNVANTDLSKIENPDMMDRQSWIERISMCHWNFDELKSGEAWNFFRQYI